MKLSKFSIPLDYNHDYWKKNYVFLKDYIMSSFGHPIVRVELTERHLIQSIHDSVSQYFKYRDGSADLFFEELPIDSKTTISGSNGTGEINFVSLPNHIDPSLVKDVVFVESSNAFGFMNPVDEGFVATFPLNSFMNMNGGVFDLGQYYMARQNLADANLITGRQKHFEIINGGIKIFPAKIDSGKVGVLYGKIYDPNDLESDDWIRAYSVASAKIILGTVRRKFSGFAAAGGSATSDGSDLINEGKTEQAELILQLKEQRPALGMFQY